MGACRALLHLAPVLCLCRPLAQSLQKLGINDSQINEIIKEVDKDASGTIDYNEFCIMMRALE